MRYLRGALTCLHYRLLGPFPVLGSRSDLAPLITWRSSLPFSLDWCRFPAWGFMPASRMVDRLVVTVIAWCCVITFTGCASRDPRTGSEVAAGVAMAWASREENAFFALFDKTARSRAAQLWQSTDGVQVTSVDPIDDQQWHITWSVPATRASTRSVVRPVLNCDRDCALVDLVQFPDQPAPIWLLGQVMISIDANVVVLDATAGGRVPALAEAARSRLSQSGVPLLDMTESIIVEVPATAGQFEQMMAAPALDFRSSGGLTWTAGSLTTPALQHIVLNPQTIDSAVDTQLEHLITHEMVHASTAYLQVGSGRQWVSEGLAEHLSLAADQAAQRGSVELLAQMCPLATTIVADSDFAADNPARAYAWSTWAVGQIMATDPASLRGLWQGNTPVPKFDDSLICG